MEENIKYLKDILENEEKPRAVELKKRSEDFVNKVSRNGGGFGAVTSDDEGTISLLYSGVDKINNIIDNCTDNYYNRMQKQYDSVDELLEQLCYTSFGIGCDIDECHAAVQEQTHNLIDFRDSLGAYNQGVIEMEDNLVSKLSFIQESTNISFKTDYDSGVSEDAEIMLIYISSLLTKRIDELSEDEKEFLDNVEGMLGVEDYNKLKEIIWSIIVTKIQNVHVMDEDKINSEFGILQDFLENNLITKLQPNLSLKELIRDPFQKSILKVYRELCEIKRDSEKEHVCYIFYQPGVVSGDQKHLFDNEAEIEKMKYEEKYPGTNVILIPVNDPKEFESMWNSMDDSSKSIDAVQIILHGSIDPDVEDEFKGSGFLYFDYGDHKNDYRIVADTDVFSSGYEDKSILISDLKNKKMKELYFSSCNSANPDAKNTASEFAKIVDAKKIVGWDGGTVYDYNDEEPEKSEERKGGEGKYLDWDWSYSFKNGLSIFPHSSTGQHTWWRFVDKDEYGWPVRKREGKVYVKGEE